MRQLVPPGPDPLDRHVRTDRCRRVEQPVDVLHCYRHGTTLALATSAERAPGFFVSARRYGDRGARRHIRSPPNGDRCHSRLERLGAHPSLPQRVRPTLRPGDQVVVVDNGSHDETAHAVTAYRWVEVVANAENQGFARACNHGAAVAQGEAIVFLNNDTVVSEGWLDELVAPLAGPDVGAVGPRSDNVSGHQATAAVRYSPDQPDVSSIGPSVAQPAPR